MHRHVVLQKSPSAMKAVTAHSQRAFSAHILSRAKGDECEATQ